MNRSFSARLMSHLRWRGQQIAGVPRKVGNVLFGTAYNDIVLSKSVRRTPGTHPLGKRVCVYMIYPVTGLRQSHLDTLKALGAAGFGVIVVSNLPLDAKARTDLAACSTMVIERPNFGYDFGAYREGILSLRRQRPTLACIVLLNDSVWFPVGAGDWLAAAADAPQNFLGAVSNLGVQIGSDEDGADVLWDYDTGRAGFHYCSFALRFDAAILSDEGFWRFWKRFRLTNDKFTTIRRGELGLSDWVFSRGYSHAETFPVRQLADFLKDTDADTLLTIAEDLVIPEDAGLRARKRSLLDTFSRQALSPGDAVRLRRFILESVAETGPAYALPGFAIGILKFPFLKKSPIWLDEDGRRVTLDILRRFCPESYVGEAQALLRARGL